MTTKSNFILACLFSLFCISSISAFDTSQKFKHFYIEIVGLHEVDYKFVFGEIKYDAEAGPEKKPFVTSENMDIEDIFFDEFKGAYLSLDEDQSDVMFYIHGQWGNTKDFFEMSTKAMYKDIFEHDQNETGICISYIWDCKVNYKNNVKIALDKGKHFGDFTDQSLKLMGDLKDQKKPSEVNFLCHSMGNKVFQGVHSVLETKGFNSPPINILIQAGSDLIGNVYEAGQPMDNITEIVKEILIYRHNDDRTLKMAKLIYDHTRMGLDGLDLLEGAPDNITIVDVSIVDDNNDFASKFSKHRYYFTSPTVRQDMLYVLSGEEASSIANRKPMKRSRTYKLLYNPKVN